MNCGGSCSSLCAYQSFWFEWPLGEFLDLDSLSWVSIWNSTTQIELNDPLLSGIPLCRSLVFYVDPLSPSSVELGTITHPYKELESVFLELFNVQSHSKGNITIKIREDTTNYLNEGTYIMNITQVRIESYSLKSLDIGKAKWVLILSSIFID